jgi:ABC-type multidrug transport system fused ATPase/permease subunit
MRSAMSIVSQEPILFDATIAENIAYAMENATHLDIVAAAEKANINEFIISLPQV